MVSLVLIAGAGLAPFVLAWFDPSQGEEDIRIYPGPKECEASRLRSPTACQTEYDAARALYPTAAPLYPSREACAAVHGPDECLPVDGTVTDPKAPHRPRMAGYLIGVRAGRGPPPQPVFRRAEHGTTREGDYCTGSGVRIFMAAEGRSSAALVPAAALRDATFGGFGQTGCEFPAGTDRGSSGG